MIQELLKYKDLLPKKFKINIFQLLIQFKDLIKQKKMLMIVFIMKKKMENKYKNRKIKYLKLVINLQLEILINLIKNILILVKKLKFKKLIFKKNRKMDNMIKLI